MSSLGRQCALTCAAILLLPKALFSLQKPGESFQAPLKNFTVLVPNLPFGTKVQKKNDKDLGMVSFLGATGDVRRIDYQRLPPDFNIPTDSITLRRFTETALISLLEPNHGTVEADSAISLPDQEAWFALVHFPNASRLVDSTGTRLDAVRGLLLFVRQGFAYTLSVEPGVMDTGPGHQLNAPYAIAMLTKFYGSIAFH